jgi:glycosyltransferase involved in cell wall biosynthesis
MHPFFSIVIPTFNAEKTLGLTLNSIKEQRFSNLEILILDGGSSDRTLSIVDQFNDLKIQVFSGPDLGTYDAMNKGINLAQGQWLYFLGSDDIFYNEFVLERVFNIINSTTLPVVYGSVLIDGNTGWAKDGEIYAGYFSRYRLLNKSICHQAIFYKREFLIQNNLFFNLKYFVSADWDLNLRCRRLSKFKYVNMIIAVFKAGGISFKNLDSFARQIKGEFSDLYPSELVILFDRIGRKVISFFK